MKLNKHTLRAAASGVLALAAYLYGVLPSGAGLGDVTFVQWLGAVLFIGASYGITVKASKDTTE